jgi:cytochrome c553
MPSVIHSWVRALALTAALLGVCSVQAAGDAAHGKVLGYTCLGCHGIDNYKNVYPTYNVPELNGQHPEYLMAALKEYRSKERSHATMAAQGGSLSDDQIADVATYLAGPETLKAGPAPIGKAPEKVASLCVACHGLDGVGVTADYPTLSGQHEDYLAQALKEYRKGDRKNAVMATFVTTLSDEDIKQIAEYYAAQRPALTTVKRRTWLYSSR